MRICLQKVTIKGAQDFFVTPSDSFLLKAFFKKKVLNATPPAILTVVRVVSCKTGSLQFNYARIKQKQLNGSVTVFSPLGGPKKGK